MKKYILVAIVILVLMLAFMHFKTMKAAFNMEVNAKEAMGLPSMVEGFTSDRIQTRKGMVYLSNGLNSAFASMKPHQWQRLANSYSFFFHPTSKDIMCSYTNKTDWHMCEIPIDSITCTDMSTVILPSRLVASDMQMSTANSAESENDCRFYLYNGIYNFKKTALTAFSCFWPIARGRQLMVMPRSDITTRMMMMIQPQFVSINNSQLYRVDWDARGDATSYDSTSSIGNVVLMLHPVSNVIDSRSSPAHVTTMPEWHTAMKKAGLHPRNAKLPDDRTVTVLMYYVQWKHVNQSMIKAPTRICNQRHLLQDGINETIMSGNAENLMSVKWKPMDRHVSIQIREHPGRALTSGVLKVPAHAGGAVCVTHTNDLVIACCNSATSTSVRRFRRDRTCPPIVFAPEVLRDTKDDGYCDASLLNMADVMMKLGTGDQSNKKASFAFPVLEQGANMLAGQHLVSESGQWTCRLTHDGNLITTGNGTRWESDTAGRKAGRLVLNYNSVLSLEDSESNVYWMSSLAAPEDADDLAPFTAVLDDSGDLQVLSRKHSRPIWSSRTSAGVIIESTADAAAKRYSMMNRAAVKDMDPWKHYQQEGRLKGLYWPGPGRT